MWLIIDVRYVNLTLVCYSPIGLQFQSSSLERQLRGQLSPKIGNITLRGEQLKSIGNAAFKVNVSAAFRPEADSALIVEATIFPFWICILDEFMEHRTFRAVGWRWRCATRAYRICRVQCSRTWAPFAGWNWIWNTTNWVPSPSRRPPSSPARPTASSSLTSRWPTTSGSAIAPPGQFHFSKFFFFINFFLNFFCIY